MMDSRYSNEISHQKTADTFPHGLRVLVVDDDLTWLKIIEKMLKKCFYQVTTCCLGSEALNILREGKDGFDIVIIDVNMPDMDGFKLLGYVGLEMDLPVIMMSVDGETSRVMRGIQHGACDYLLKPIRMKELKNIWQHVVRKKKNELRDFEDLKGVEKIQVVESGISDQSDDGYLFCARDMNFGKKRKGFESKYGAKEFVDLSAPKKTRVVWTVELHQKFVRTVNHIGLDKIGPKKILDLMNVPWLTRENVASHLQKYRLYLSRLQKKDNSNTSFSGIKHSDPYLEEQVASIGSRDISLEKTDANRCTYGIPGGIVVQNAYSDNYEAESKAAYIALSSIVPSPCSWSRNVPGIEIKQEYRPQLEMTDVQNQMFSNILQFAPNIRQTPIREINNLPHVEIKTPCSNQNIPKQTLEGVAYELCPVQSNSGIRTCFYSEPNAISTRSMNSQLVEHISASNLDSLTHMTCFNKVGLLPEDHILTSLEPQNREFFDCSNLELFTNYSPYLYDGLMFM